MFLRNHQTKKRTYFKRSPTVSILTCYKEANDFNLYHLAVCITGETSVEPAILSIVKAWCGTPNSQMKEKPCNESKTVRLISLRLRAGKGDTSLCLNSTLHPKTFSRMTPLFTTGISCLHSPVSLIHHKLLNLTMRRCAMVFSALQCCNQLWNRS